MKISIATSVFVNYPIQEAAQEIYTAGYDGIDFWCGRPHLYRKDYSPGELHSLRTWLVRNKIPAVSCLPAFFRYPYSLSSSREVVRQESISYMKDTIDVACELSAACVLVVPTGCLHGQTTQDAKAWFTDSLAQISTYAEQNAMKLGIEIVYPALSDYMNRTDDALEVIGEVNSPILGVVLDSGHLNLSGEDIPQAIRNLGDYLLQVHVNDNDSRHQQNNIPGEGCFDFPQFIKLLRENSYNGYLAVEIGWQYSFNPVPAVTEALQRMRKIVAAEI
jgi:protein FrlC